EFDAAGFAAPNHSGGYGFYNVSFENMGPYGYCTTSGVDGGELTRLVLHNSYVGFGANQDPDGNIKGAMKVTCAHEFKHASQRVHSYWSEGGWVELDATWAEEFVYDYVNDSMLNFMGYGDPFSHPHWGLDHGGTGSYEDFAWEDFMHQRFDDNSYSSAPVIQYFWTWRETHTGQNTMDSYAQALTNAGSSLTEAFEEYVVWNFFTGARAVMSGGISQFGYDESGVAGFPTATLAATHSSYPVSASVSGIENLGAKMIRLNPAGEAGLEIIFDGQNSVAMSAMWAIRYVDNTVDWGSIELDASNDGSIVLDVREATMAALIPVVTQINGSSYSASYTIDPHAKTVCTAGDLNDDGAWDVSDLVRLVAVILGNGAEPNDIELCAGDVNADDQTTVQDVVTLVGIILQ
ncbi:MAG: dockerin type I repeat-containing protein, partial [Candidatus Marinimicrobia bacterium]|nr:dockerin type I repeat-containing protein [Candidatus Neomarinimicrobiota bacterium]